MLCSIYTLISCIWLSYVSLLRKTTQIFKASYEDSKTNITTRMEKCC